MVLLQNVSAVSDTAAQAASQGTGKISYMEMAQHGGIIMIILGVLSIIAVYIFVDKFMAVKKSSKDDQQFMNNIKENIQKGNVDAAMTTCSTTNSPLARMLAKGIKRIGRPLNDINAAVENVGKQEIARLERGLPVLASIAGGAPMIGFLGTVMGMIQAFFDMANAGNNIDVQLLSNGIYTAMVTTVGGLIVGIIAYFAYNLIVSRIDNLVSQLESRTTEFMDILNEPA
ncbi:MAG: MotA/TolQ/ExbB proton channel family protein [Candidatus Delongbacteria bacterium]|jgi:biopolymer transport protein ExbB|nr:MotA/TolQ/ExbB proton channel family protein [Candidatus Delongbacteria bacterium]